MVDKAPEGKSPLDYAEKAVKSNIDPETIAKVVVTLDNAASQMLKQFGQGQAMADILRMSMSESVTSVRKLGGDIADVLKIQKEAAEGLGRNVTLTEETTKDLYATVEVTGQSVKQIVAGMADAGIGAGKAAGEMLKVDQNFLDMVSKLQTYYEKFKSKWAKIMASRKKTISKK